MQTPVLPMLYLIPEQIQIEISFRKVAPPVLGKK